MKIHDLVIDYIRQLNVENADPDESEHFKPYDRVGTEGPLSVYRYLKELYAISNTSINVKTQRMMT